MQVLTDGLKSLRNILGQENPQASPGTQKTRIISICSQKGGVGKTTTAVNLAYDLAVLYQKKVLVVDLDPQGHVETSVTDLVPDGQRYRPISGVLLDKKPDLAAAIVKTETEGLWMTPGDKSLIETESLLTTKIGKEFILREALREVQSQFDYVIFDCPPNLGNLTLNALVASQHCIVPCEMSMLSLEGVSDIFETIQTINERLNKKLSVLGILLTRVDARNVSLNRSIRDQLEKHASAHLFEAEIGVNTALTKAQMAGKPILSYAASSNGSHDYKQFTDEVLRRLHDYPEASSGKTKPLAV